ncbi:hypothetical protein ACFYSJ_26705 [Streptomyces sp. NPDC005248]|uniref:hypothetical protein n=1 Tax=Streptomyces sp. NPDC005248 TaxID=3364709 RepID=UPI0036A0FC18
MAARAATESALHGKQSSARKSVIFLTAREKLGSRKATIGRAAFFTLGPAVLQLTGGLLAISLLGHIAGDLERGSISWISPLEGLAGFASCLVSTGLIRRYSKYAYGAIVSALGNGTNLREHEYVLYLRPFDVDEVLFETTPIGWRNSLSSFVNLLGIRTLVKSEATDEERMLGPLFQLGRIVGVGHPRENYPQPGAERYYLPQKVWKSEVRKLIKGARLVIIAAAIPSGGSDAKGTLWELREVVRSIPPSRLTLICCGNELDYKRFCKAVSGCIGIRGDKNRKMTLPSRPAARHPKKLRNPSPLHGIVRFNADWGGEFVHFDPTIEKRWTHRARWEAALKSQVYPALNAIEGALPGDAQCAPTPSMWKIILKWLPLLVATLTFNVSRVIGDDGLVISEKITYSALPLVLLVSVIWNNFHTARLASRMDTRIAFSSGRN